MLPCGYQQEEKIWDAAAPPLPPAWHLVWVTEREEEDGRSKALQMAIPVLLLFCCCSETSVTNGIKSYFPRNPRLEPEREYHSLGQPVQATGKRSGWLGGIFISLFQKTILQINLPALRRWNQQFDELGASLYCSTGLKGKLLLWVRAIVESHNALQRFGKEEGLQQGMRWDFNQLGKEKKWKLEIL